MGSISLSLRPPGDEQAENPSIPELVTRINNDHGHFRHITEQSLLEEIALEEAKKDSIDDNDGSAEEKENAESRREQIYAARGEMLKLIGQAQNEALTALDFISLLISREAPAQANSSMSPVLKRLVPPGTLGYDRNPASKPTVADREDSYKVVFGWNLQNLDAVADKLISSATRLEKEMQKETQYWQQALSLRDKGWAVCRMPRERHTLGVRFGFSEASPLFYSKGLAALRSDENGRLYLDQGSAYQEKCLQVQLIEDGNIVEESKLRPTILSSSDVPLEELVEQARDSLFDEELFHELGREARDLLAYGVRVRDGAVYFPLLPPSSKQFSSSGKKMSESPPECVVRLIHTNSDTLATMPTQSSARAESILLAMRILLTDSYRRKAKHRARPPPPLSNQRHRIPSFSIVEPVMHHVQHIYLMEQLKNYCGALNNALRHTGIPCIMSVHNNNKFLPSSFTHSTATTSKTTMTTMELIIQALCNPIESEIALTCSEGDAANISVKVCTRSSGMDGTRGTELTVHTSYALATTSTADLNTYADLFEPTERQYSDFSDVKSCISLFVNDFLPVWALSAGAAESGWTSRIIDADNRPTSPARMHLVHVTKRSTSESKQIYLHCTPRLWKGDTAVALVGSFTNTPQRVLAQWDGNTEHDEKNNKNKTLLERLKALSKY